MTFSRLVASLATFAFAHGAAAATIWDEGVNGDFSGNRLAPTALAVAVGTNTISGSTITGDVDYFTFTVPVASTFTQMVLSSYGATNVAFIAIQSGSIITETPGAPNPANLLGYLHFGPVQVGTDVLDEMGASNGSSPAAQGFALPLGPGDYAFWLQQGSPTPTSYSFDIVVVPEPSTGALFTLGLVALALVRRRRE